jgi:trehalose 6-phosphate synthase
VLLGRLVLLHDLSFIDRRSQDTRRYLIGLITALGFVIALITMVVAQLSWRGWVNGARAHHARRGPAQPADARPRAGAVCRDLRARLRDLEDEYRRSQGPEAEWTPSACARCCARSSAATRSSWCPTASRTSTSVPKAVSSSSVRPAGW